MQYEVFPFVLQALILICLQNNLLKSDKEVRRENARCCKTQSTVPSFLFASVVTNSLKFSIAFFYPKLRTLLYTIRKSRVSIVFCKFLLFCQKPFYCICCTRVLFIPALCNHFVSCFFQFFRRNCFINHILDIIKIFFS